MRDKLVWAMACGVVGFVFGTAAAVTWDSDPTGAAWMAGIAAINLLIAYRAGRNA